MSRAEPVGDRIASARDLPPRAEAAIRAILRDGAIPGASVAICVAGQPARVAALGTRDLARATPLTPDDRFYVYSITKTLLAAVALRLAARDLVALDAPARDALPAIDLPAAITPRHLLGHTAGLPDYGGLPAYNAAIRATPGVAWSDEQFLDQTLPRGLLFTPGTAFAYSNIGYLLVRLLIGRATGGSLGATLDRELFAPLGLRHTGVIATLTDAAVLSPGWSQFLDPEGAALNIAPRYHPGWVAHGVVGSTAAELATLVEAIVTGPLLDPDERATMLTPRVLPIAHPPFRQPAYGLGVMIDPASPYGCAAGHIGGGPGYAAAAFHFSALAGQPTTIAALLNRDHGDAAIRTVYAVAEALVG